jgi:hypothetical protein
MTAERARTPESARPTGPAFPMVRVVIYLALSALAL